MVATFPRAAMALDWVMACQAAMLTCRWDPQLLQHELCEVGKEGAIGYLRGGKSSLPGSEVKQHHLLFFSCKSFLQVI